MRLLLCFVIAVAGCHHDDPPPVAPKPSSTGTPIGYLLDEPELRLTDEQQHELRGIDATLKLALERFDHDTKPKTPPATGSNTPAPAMRAGGHHRGRGPGAMRATPTNRGSGAPAVSGVDEQRADIVRAAIEASLARLGPEQQKRALRVLVDHDVDYDTGSTGDDEQIEPPEP